MPPLSLSKAKGRENRSIVDCVATIGYDVDIWTKIQTLMLANLSAVQDAIGWKRDEGTMGWTRRARSPVFDLCRVNDSPSVIPVVTAECEFLN